MSLSKEAKERLVIALTDEKVAEEVADTIDLGVESGGVTIDDSAPALDKTYSSTKIEAIAGGGGGGIPLLTTDPVTPADEEQWYLYTVGVSGTSLTSLNGGEVGSGLEWINIGAHTNADLSTAFPADVVGQAMNINQGSGLDVPSLDAIEYEDSVSTVNALMAEINAFAFPIFGANVVQLAAGIAGTELMGSVLDEEFTVVTVDEAGNMQSSSFLLGESVVSGLGYLWFNVALGGTDPVSTGNAADGLEIAVASGATAGAIGDSIAAAITGDTLNGGGPRWVVTSNDNNGTVVIEEQSGNGDVNDGQNIDTPFTVSTSRQGGVLGPSNADIESDSTSATMVQKIYKGGQTFKTSMT